jgi:hypothetical protein
MRFTAPPHITQAQLSIGVVQADENGVIETPDNLPVGDLGGLIGAGFVLASPAAAKPAKPAKEG